MASSGLPAGGDGLKIKHQACVILTHSEKLKSSLPEVL